MKKTLFNEEKIEGYAYSIESNNEWNSLSVRKTGSNSKNPGEEYIFGELNVAVDEDGLNVITIHYTYITPVYKKSGKANSIYTTLQKIIDNQERTWIKGGKENDFKVSCVGVSFSINDFIAGDGSKDATVRNEGGFVSIFNEFSEERNKYTTDILITKVTHINADPEKNISNDYTSVNSYVFGYGPLILPISFVVRNEGVMSFFEDLDISGSIPVFTKVWGKINCITIKITRTEESEFEEAAVQTYEKKCREYTIIGTSKFPYNFGEEDVLTIEQVNKMIQDRQIKFAEIEERHKKINSEKSSSSNATPMQEIPIGDFKF
jgi:hypothetical protein